MTKSETLLDTCCIINFCAIQRPPAELFAEFPFKWEIATAVAQEEVSIRPHAAAGRHERQRIDLRPSFDAGVFELCQISTPEETALYVKLATQMGDGEAMSLAIASCRGWSVATDDMAARRTAVELNVKTYCTPQLLRIWAEGNGLPTIDVANAIDKIEVLARYIPRLDLPDADWWVRSRTR